MTNDFIAIGAASAARPARGTDERGKPKEVCAISVNAAKVLETTRRAWRDADASQTQVKAERRPPRASNPKKRVVPRRSRWPSLVAALNDWSPKPL
ncbi:hypothetical protein [Caballeronia ptereochthonis]|uniref:Uncharacterized protein n=1 Tax=Caballeronia ptereochthonis TaxID=1777144 RepID=A0A157Z5W3_9BURK|nr:hypothetical protein [Caballeronia ptereochthonis]SAK40966.1 hypothetical protein AWB83_00233 [Caballeronia ptereochthonis]